MSHFTSPAKDIPAMKSALPGSLGGVVLVILLVLLLAGLTAWRRAGPENLTDWRDERLAVFQAWQAVGPAREIWDHPDAPVLVTVPAGNSLQGAPETEAERFPEESPQRAVTIEYGIQVHDAAGSWTLGEGELLTARMHAFHSHDGFAVEDGWIHLPDGTLLATTRQTRLAG